MTVSDRARRVRLLCVDVDGVLTDAGMYYGPDGEVLKKFNTRDGDGAGAGARDWHRGGDHLGRGQRIVHARAAKLKIDDVFCGVANKRVGHRRAVRRAKGSRWTKWRSSATT